MSTDAVVSAVKESAAAGMPLRIAGRSAWLDAGRPVRADKTLSLREDSGVVSYVPGDLTITVRAGTTLAEIEQITGEHNQWLPLEPYGSPDGTICATIATASAGPLAPSFGLPRDLVLGLEFVNGRGEVVRGGGKVVKNVAGYDLSRLLTGSWGTLGVITELTLRLYARPQVDRSFVMRLTERERETTSFLHAFLAAPFAPYAFELVSASAAAALGLGNMPICLLRLGGNTPSVEAQVRAISQIATLEDIDGSVWGKLRSLEVGSGCVIRVSGLPTSFRSASATILNDPQTFFTYINPRRGVLRLIAPPNGTNRESEESVLGLSLGERFAEGVTHEVLPREIWEEVSPTVIGDGLSQRIKRAYDPRNILNPGILGDLM